MRIAVAVRGEDATVVTVAGCFDERQVPVFLAVVRGVLARSVVAGEIQLDLSEVENFDSSALIAMLQVQDDASFAHRFSVVATSGTVDELMQRTGSAALRRAARKMGSSPRVAEMAESAGGIYNHFPLPDPT